MSGAIAIIGAGGFVGTRLVESLVLGGETRIRAIVRAYRSFAGLARFGPAVTVELANAENRASLVHSLRGCSAVVNLTAGASAGIFRSTKAIHEACLAAGVRRLIHMSSAVVYGEIASAAVADDSPPLPKHWMPYARAKAVSEIWLRERMPTPSCQVAVLRPGIVWGVRSPHTMDVVRSLAAKCAYLVNNGQGIFNSIYVDNLVACILACRDHPSDVTGFYNVADDEVITWRGFYTAFAEHLGYDMAKVPNVPGDRLPCSANALLDYVQSLPLAHGLFAWIKSRLPDTAKAKVKAFLAGRHNYERISSAYVTKPRVDRELWHLQKVKYKLSNTKFARHFSFTPPVSFEEGVRRTVCWLAFLGYVPPKVIHTNTDRVLL